MWVTDWVFPGSWSLHIYLPASSAVATAIVRTEPFSENFTLVLGL